MTVSQLFFKNQSSDLPVTADHPRQEIAPPCCSTHVFRLPGPRSDNTRAHISGVSVSEINPDAKIATMIVIENSRKIRPNKLGRNTSGMNTAASDSVIERMVKRDLPRAVDRRLHRSFSPGLGPPHDVFQKHHRVVHEEPDGQASGP